VVSGLHGRALWSDRRFRTFNVNDDFNRQALRIEIDTSLPSARVVRVLDELVELRGPPRRLRLERATCPRGTTDPSSSVLR